MRRWTDGLRLGDHVLHVYHDEQERERAFLDLFTWLPKQAKLCYFHPGADYPAIMERKDELGERLRGSVREGVLSVSGVNELYSPDGSFDSRRILRDLVRTVEAAESEGFSTLVAVGDGTWVSSRREIFPEFLRYESAVNFLAFPLDVAFLCQYDCRAFSTENLAQVAAVHDQVLMNNKLERKCWILPRRGMGGRMALSP